jgi:hypothetical protein
MIGPISVPGQFRSRPRRIHTVFIDDNNRILEVNHSQTGRMSWMDIRQCGLSVGWGSRAIHRAGQRVIYTDIVKM